LPPEFGFYTNASSKVLIINNLLDCLRETRYIEPDSQFITEAYQYEYKQNGKMGAKDGCNDDVIMTTAIGLYVSETMPIPKHK
jgi:hypothetical protein